MNLNHVTVISNVYYAVMCLLLEKKIKTCSLLSY